MKNKGCFKVYNSFTIKERNEFYLLGEVEGEIKENWYLKICLNSSLWEAIRITKIETIKFSSEENEYCLLTMDCIEENENYLDFLWL